ncbi:unnamed protein product [Chironomus riparius]|uniref:SH3 domain-containing protein n=1 Tax=Chironomus riparius TaxID=315576 RepID=A0A9N9RWS7_9DIPT|nr:unnamed protein product [Chironomus riparius]
MKYVTRPAPAPPGSQLNTMNNNHVNPAMSNKPKPPRPPPPRVTDQKPAAKEPMRIFSNLFGASKKSSNKSNEKLSQMEVKLPLPRLPPPTSTSVRQNQNFTTLSSTVTAAQLINFDESPPESPVGFIKKSNTGGSDSVSIDSFCSTNSSPNNFGLNSGTTSQAESGFEDDFSVSDFKVSSRAASRSTTFSNDPFDCLDEFSSSTKNQPVKTNNFGNIRNLKPLIQPKPVSIGNTNFYSTSNSSAPSPANFDDTLSNGKNLVKPQILSMPTIIKPASQNSNRKPSPIHVPLSSQNNDVIKKKSLAPLPPVQYKQLDSTSDESFEDEPPSPPMPTIPAPVLVFDGLNNDANDEEKDSYGIALYDYESEVTEDLNFRANEKIYLIQQMNDEWMYGKNKRGCEGIFPISYVEIKVPLKNPQTDSGTASRSESVSPAVTAVSSHRVRALYTFDAETDGDLTILENEIVNVMYEINSEWLYGSNSYGQYGQFPSNFIEFIPHNLPPMPK